MPKGDSIAEISVLCFRVAYPWMGRHSGYDALYHALSDWEGPLRLSCVNLPPANPGFLRRRILNRFYWKTRASDQYTYRHADTEVRFRAKARRENPDILYYFAGDESIGLAGTSPDKFGARVTATLHQPATWWKLLHRRHDYLKQLDDIIVVSTAQSAFVEEVTGRRPFFLPHGVDTNFYRPAERKKTEAPSFLFVGQWLRDFEALNAIIEETLTKAPDAIFHLVVPEWRRSEPILLRIGRHANCRFYAGLSDQELLELYQTSTALVMPVIEATANNAIIEAAATGLPIVATDCRGIRDYTHDSFSFLIRKNDPHEFAERLLRIAADQSLANTMQKAARKFACTELDWKVVIPKLIDRFQVLHNREVKS